MVAYLRAHYNDLLSLLTDRMLEEMVASTIVTEIVSSDDENDVSAIIYQKGVSSDTCTLILSGKVTALVGKDDFRSEMGPWSVLATQALTNLDYVPDFSAFVSSGSCRCLRITRHVFAAAKDASARERISRTDEPKDAGPSDIIDMTDKEDDPFNANSTVNGNMSIKDRKHLRSELLAVFNQTITASKLDEALKAGGADQAICNGSSEHKPSPPSGMSAVITELTYGGKSELF